MEDAKSTDEDDQFFDSSDEFPFYDCPDSFESPLCLSSSNVVGSPAEANFFGGGLRRRRSLRNRKLDQDFSVESTKRSVVEDESEEKKEISSVTIEGISEESSPPVRESENDELQLNILLFLAELVVKAIGFQFNLLISFLTFPCWALYHSCMLVVNPFHSIRLVRGYLIGKSMRLWKLVGDSSSPLLSEWLKEHKSVVKLALRCGWGLFWSAYVCSILVSLLISAFVIGGLMMRFYVVEEPFQLKQALNFDYTRSKPVAFVPVITCATVECAEKDEVVNNAGFVRVIPPKHSLKATVTLILPESDYNRNLGIFQVRVDFLSENGKSLASLSHPCMLEFKSEPLRLLLTFSKIIPLIAGYVSESQTLNLKFRGYTEGSVPTACVKITIEQRAQFRPGAGVPEIYDAFLHLESELPFLRRILWYWRKTIFVWLSMVLFVVELLFALVCCRPVIIPRARTRGHNDTRSSGPLTTHPVER